MKLIELHILQSFPVTCLNRDDVGAPKSAVFGGEPRARVSSQCWKRAIRTYANELKPESFGGQRGHFVAEPLQAELEALGVEAKAAEKAAHAVVESIGKRDSKFKEGHKSSVALYLSNQELKGIAQSIAAEAAEGKKIDVKRGAIKKAISAAQPRDIADIAIFGRMVADDHSLSLEGAGMFSHALSTHRVSNEIDFFSAVDDLKPEDSAGAGHIGTLEFNAACYYRYVGVNLDLLADENHLGHLDADTQTEILDAFVRSAIHAVPNARHNSMLGHNPPSAILGSIRTGQPLSLANAFEQPIRKDNGFVAPSIKAMREHHDSLTRIYGNAGQDCWLDTTRSDSLDLDGFIKELLAHV